MRRVNETLAAIGAADDHFAQSTPRELARYAAAHQHLDEVAHLRHRIATLVGIDSP